MNPGQLEKELDTGKYKPVYLFYGQETLLKERLLKQPGDFGLVLESFVYNELRKQSVWIDEPLRDYYQLDGKPLGEQDMIRVTLTLDNGIEDLDVLREQGSVVDYR